MQEGGVGMLREWDWVWVCLGGLTTSIFQRWGKEGGGCRGIWRLWRLGLGGKRGSCGSSSCGWRKNRSWSIEGGCTCLLAWAVNADVAEVLALVAADGLFDIFVGGGEMVADSYSSDEEGVCRFWSREGDFQVGEALCGVTQMRGFCPASGVDAVDGDACFVGEIC